ncbi:CysZ-like protein [compost metagenome]
MGKVFKAFRQSFESLLSPKILGLVLMPPLISFFGLLLIFMMFWSGWVTGLEVFFQDTWIFQMLGKAFAAIGLQDVQGVAGWIAAVFLILLFLPLTILVAVIITSIFVMPVALELIRRQDFKHLERRRGGSTMGSLWNTLKVSAVFIFAFAVTLPLWLIPGCQIAIPVLLAAWLNKRIFVYDVLQDFASREERKLIETQERGGLYGMGVLLGLMAYIPFAFLVIPVVAALCYIYYCLNELDRLRSPAT